MLGFALKAAQAEVIPFLLRIEASIRAGQSAPEAYADSLRQTHVLKHLVGEPVKGLPFTQAVLQGAKNSHLRSLVFFAQQAKLRERSGDSLKEAFSKAAHTTLVMQDTAKGREEAEPPSKKKLLLIGGAAAIAAGALAVSKLRK